MNEDDTYAPPRPSRAPLYAIGATVLGLAWVAVLRSSDAPGESAAERRLRSRVNPVVLLPWWR